MTETNAGPAYVHGYGSPEQQRLVDQAEHWRHGLICDQMLVRPGTRLLEVGCGVGAVLAVLGQEYPGVRLTGVDIEPAQLVFAAQHLERCGVGADLVEADGSNLPFADTAFDHVWMMWFLEHLSDPLVALREARRVLRLGGRITAVEVDYGTCRVEPRSPHIEALFAAAVRAMATAGWSNAGTQLPLWLKCADFREVDGGERVFWWKGRHLDAQASYAADVFESASPALLAEGLTPDELRAALRELRGLCEISGAGLGWIVHKATAIR